MREVNPNETSRAYAFEMWMNAPMPMVTLFKTLNVSRLVKISRKTGLKFNMLVCGYGSREDCFSRADDTSKAGRKRLLHLLPRWAVRTPRVGTQANRGAIVASLHNQRELQVRKVDPDWLVCLYV